MAVSIAALAYCELSMMRAETPEQFATGLRWLHVPSLLTIVSLVGFVRFYLDAGRPWLAWLTCGLRALSLLLNFLVGQNLNYLTITRLRHIPFLGESVSIAEGVPNPLMLVGQLSLVLLVIFVVDAALAVWRRGDRRKALVVGGSLVFFSLTTTVLAVLVLWQIVPIPLTASFFYLGIVGAMGYELSRDAYRATQLSEALREGEERYRTLFDRANDGIVVLSAEGKLISVNESFARMHGYTVKEMEGLSLTRLDTPDTARMISERSRRILAGEAMVFEVEHYHKDGHVFPLEVSASRICLGGKYYIQCFHREITERKKNESEMLELRHEIAHLTRVMAMNELSTSLAHEINQPLGAILNNASAAKVLMSDGKNTSEDIGEILADIIQDTKRAGDVVRKIRGMVKKDELRFESLNMNKLIASVVDLLENSIRINGVSLRLDLQPDLANVKGERVHLQQVLLNLILNALEAMKGKSPRILMIRSRMTESDMVTVSVIDSGKGIDEAKKESMFNPFVTTKKDGLGMGLSICKSIIAEHDGRIEVANNPVSGATFSFSLKVYRGESA